MPERNQGRTQDRTRESDKPQPENPASEQVPEAARKLAEEFGLIVTKSQKNGTLVFSKTAQDCASKPEIVAQGADLKALRTDLTKKRDDYIERLEDEHLVDILVEGEQIGIKDGNGKPLTADVRTPNFSQLASIEHALERSMPADEDRRSGIVGWFAELFDNDRVKIGLAKSDTDPGTAARYFQGNVLKGILPRIVIDPDVQNSSSVYLHELAHHGQAGFWNSDDGGSQRWNEYRTKLGWVKVGDRELRLTNDSTPQMFVYAKDEKQGERWLRMDDKGNFLDAKGNRVDSEEKAQRISNAEMTRRALVGPPDDRAYMRNPKEHGAELVMHLRNNQNSRSALLKFNSHAYKVAVELDQREIDAFYGKTWTGESRRIRMPNGEIVENNEESRMQLEVWESINSRAPERTNSPQRAVANNVAAQSRFNPNNPAQNGERPAPSKQNQQFEPTVRGRQQQSTRQFH